MNLSELKHDRLSEAEKFLLDIFDGLKENIRIDCPARIFYIKDNKVIFEYNSKTYHLYYSYDYMWDVFREKYDNNFHEFHDLVKSMVVRHLNLSIKSLQMSVI